MIEQMDLISEIRVLSTPSLYFWVQHLQIQPNADGKCLEKNCICIKHVKTFPYQSVLTVRCNYY